MIRKPLALALTALTGVSSPIVAQRQGAERIVISGVVTDQVTGTVVIGALVEFPGLRGQTLTDKEGRFTVTGLKTGKHNMVVSHIGFKTLVREQQIADGEMLVVALEPDPVMLRGIEVQVDRLSTRRKGVHVAVETFNRPELMNSAALSAAEFVRTRMMMRGCPSGRGLCVIRRGQAVSPAIYIDERRAFGLDELEAYPSYDIYLIESYDGGRMVRVYTNWFMQNLARNKASLQQLILW